MAYVFVDILPHLAKKQQWFVELGDEGIHGFLYHHIYILALAGFLVYLGVILSVARRGNSVELKEAAQAQGSRRIWCDLITRLRFSNIGKSRIGVGTNSRESTLFPLPKFCVEGREGVPVTQHKRASPEDPQGGL